MHIAICDDNGADRRQIERLLKRESDKRTSSGKSFYTDSFGNAQALLACPMRYDGYYIDICHTAGIDGSMTAAAVREKKIYSPVFLCCSEIDYRKLSCPENVFFLEKPLLKNDLSDSIDQIWEAKASGVPLIELRDEQNTYYISEEEILYAKDVSLRMEIVLTDGRRLLLPSSAENFYAQNESFPTFFCPNPKLVVNGRYISQIGFFKITMQDGSVFRVGPNGLSYAKYIHENFKPQQ